MCILCRRVDLIIFVGVMGLGLFSVKILVTATSVTACRIAFIFSRIVGHDV
jgi:hypothetical protein